MAKRAHVALLKRGAKVWNQWREDNPWWKRGALPDLEGADLNLDLPGVDLRSAILFGANLMGSDLTGADLTGAGLSGANVDAVNFTDAILEHTSLNYASARAATFVRTNAKGANFEGTNLYVADLTDANLEGAQLGHTVFGATALRRTKGLATCKHLYPSVVDHITFEKSGMLPEVFLRGCGLPDQVIKFYEFWSKGDRGDRFYSCFISYSSRDQPFADRLYDSLQIRGIRCWLAPKDLRTGDKFRARIDDGIKAHDKLLLILSRSAIASPWVEKEVETAFEIERSTGQTVLFPVRIDNDVMDTNTAWAADIRRTRQITDFSGWHDERTFAPSIHRITQDLRCGPNPAAKGSHIE